MKVILTIILLYINVSFVEWYIHKYLMHNTNNKIINTLNYGFHKIYYMVHGYSQDINHMYQFQLNI